MVPTPMDDRIPALIESIPVRLRMPAFVLATVALCVVLWLWPWTSALAGVVLLGAVLRENIG